MATETFQYITLMEILQAVLSRWKLFLGVSVTGLVLSFALLAISDKEYEASAMITRPASSVGKPDLRGYSNLSGLASSLIDGGNARMNFLDVMRSEELARRLDQKHDMSKTLFGSLWDEERQGWDMGKLPLSGRVRRALRHAVNLPVPEGFTPWDIQKWLAREITTVQSKDKSAWTLMIRHKNPAKALLILDEVIKETEQILVERRRRQIDRQISFFNDQLGVLTDRDLRLTAIASLSQLQREKISLDSGVSFGAEIIYGPQVTDFPVSPVASLFILAGMFISGLTGFVAAAISGLIARSQNPRS